MSKKHGFTTPPARAFAAPAAGGAEGVVHEFSYHGNGQWHTVPVGPIPGNIPADSLRYARHMGWVTGTQGGPSVEPAPVPDAALALDDDLRAMEDQEVDDGPAIDG